MAKFLIQEVVGDLEVRTARLGTAANAGGRYTDAETGKFMKLVGDSRYALAALGDPIDRWQTSVEVATQDGYAIGGVGRAGLKAVTFGGSQAAQTGAIAIGDYVLVGTVVAAGTALTGPAKVCKATDQTAAAAAPMRARVVSLGQTGTGAVDTVGVIELLG